MSGNELHHAPPDGAPIARQYSGDELHHAPPELPIRATRAFAETRAAGRRRAARDDWMQICAEFQPNLATEYGQHLQTYDDHGTIQSLTINHVDPCVPTADDWTIAHRDIDEIVTRLIKSPRRKYSPSHSLPSEGLIMLLCPHYISKPSIDKGVLGNESRAKKPCANECGLKAGKTNPISRN